MTPQRTAQEAAAGKLISAIQKEWTAELGEPCAHQSEQAMSRAHDLLQAAKAGTVRECLNGQTVAQFLGQSWVMQHARVLPSITNFEASLP
jgi:hypothetical protein